jgi:hypothetical protein
MPHDQKYEDWLNQQLRDASEEQLQNLIARVDLLLRSKGQPGLALHPPEGERVTPGACQSLRPRHHQHRVVPSAQRTQKTSEAE